MNENLAATIAPAASLYRMGQLADASEICMAILREQPESFDALHLLGVIRFTQGHRQQAIALQRAALAVNPGAWGAHAYIGVTLAHLGRYREAITSYHKALAIKPEYAEVHHHLGIALQALNRHEEAIASYHKALAIEPDFAKAHNNLGIALRTLNRHEEAIASCRKALAIKPDFAEAHCNKGVIALAMGDFETGWTEYEWRWETADLLRYKRNFTQPLWLGREDIAGKTILLHGEQGLGDIMQFVRYVPLVAEMGATVILEVQKGLKALLGGFAGGKAVFERGEPLPSFDIHCPLMSLPLAFQTELATIPADIPYILPDPARQAQWEGRSPKRERPRIGIAWSGNPKYRDNHNRSIPLQNLMPLIRETGFNFYVLQTEIRPEDFELLKSSPSLTNHSDQLNDFADTAALMSHMDLIISVDTSLAHLAGAMGLPIWILLQFSPCWRWQLDRQDSPWYPTARLFRQPKAYDWASVIESVILECKKAIRVAT
jgi:Flp pilus assembly protein TadD